MRLVSRSLTFFFFNDTATTEIYTLSLHDALPIYRRLRSTRDHQVGGVVADQLERVAHAVGGRRARGYGAVVRALGDRKSTRLNSSHLVISYAVFCLKKKKRGSKR